MTAYGLAQQLFNLPKDMEIRIETELGSDAILRIYQYNDAVIITAEDEGEYDDPEELDTVE